MQAIKEKIAEAKDNLTVSTNSYEYDMFIKGMIQAYSDLLEIKADVQTKEDETSEI